jgi:sec-independent protein translocase protein TatC
MASVLNHFLVLRQALLRALAGVAVVFLSLVYWCNDLYGLVAKPLLAALPVGGHMIAIDVSSPLLTPVKLTLSVSFFLALPWILYQFWLFLVPALYQKERTMMRGLLFFSCALFYTGAAFAYFVLLPKLFAFMIQMTPDSVQMTTDIQAYLTFITKLLLGFGMAFEVPVVVWVLCWYGITQVESLKRQRPYFVVFAFVIGMLLTPPDVVSQFLLALPMIALYEIGLFFAKTHLSVQES